MNLLDRPTPLTYALDQECQVAKNYLSGKGYLDMRDHARQLERQCAELAEACDSWSKYDWNGGASGLSLNDVRKQITKALANWTKLKGVLS